MTQLRARGENAKVPSRAETTAAWGEVESILMTRASSHLTRCDDTVSTTDPAALAAQLVEELGEAHAARRGVPAALEATVRAYARSQREAGVDVGTFLIGVKELVRVTTGADEPLFTPRIVGWAVAGFFSGSARGG